MEVDVAIFGDGPAGCAIALRLARYQRTAAILQRAARRGVSIGETLSPTIRAPLSELEMWSRFLHSGHAQSYELRSAWGSPRLLVKNSIFDPFGPSWHVDRARFDADLLDAAQERGSVLVSYTHLGNLAYTDGNWDVLLGDGHHVRAHFLVDATGRACALARRLGARRERYDRLIALVAFSACDSSPAMDNATLIEAGPEGWWYSAVLPSQQMVVAYMTDNDLLPSDHADWRTHMLAHLGATHATRERFPLDTLPARLHVFAANSSRLDDGTGDGWLAAGDALAAYDPLCGWGVPRALHSGIQAADAIHLHLSGDDRPLRAYASSRSPFDHYLDTRDAYYSMEQRWASSRFWQRRTHRVAAVQGG
jgi:flavin-dependent dehydrogenase